MKNFTTLKSLVLVVAMLFAGISAANAQEETAKKPSSGDLVISKVYYSSSKKTTSGNYSAGQYIEIYNNSADLMDITGLYLALIESESASSSYTIADIEADEALKAAIGSKIVVKQIFQIPDDQTYTLGAGKSVVICNSAIDHTSLETAGHDLSGADFEVKTTNSNYTHNDAVPAMKLIYTMNSSLDFMNLMYSGPAGVVLLKNDVRGIDTENLIYGRGKTTGNQFALVNPYYAIDIVEILANKANTGVDVTTKRVSDTYDAGYASTAATGSYTGETVYRKTSFVTLDGRTVLYDTNNSTVDFAASSAIQPREYDETLSGITESTITIPESGFLFFQPEKSFFGTSDVTFTYVTGNAKNTDLTYNEFAGNEQLLDQGRYFAIGKPGTYSVTYSEAQPTKKVPSNLLTWATEDQIDNSSSNSLKTRTIFKFQDTADKVGFQRVPVTADGAYNKADFTDGNRIYITLTPNIINAIYAANGAASADALDFIPWHGTMPVTTAISGVKSVSPAANQAVFDLMGRRVSSMKQGAIYIIDNKKVAK